MIVVKENGEFKQLLFTVIVFFQIKNKQTSKQANKQTSTQTNKQTSKQANKQANKQTSKQTNKTKTTAPNPSSKS